MADRRRASLHRLERPGRSWPLRALTALLGMVALLGAQAGVGGASSLIGALSGRAPGPRPAYTVVGLGDSVPAAAECGCTSYVSLLADRVAGRAGRPAVVDNLAVDGQTTGDLIDQLQQPEVIGQLAAADLVVVTIGANDFDEAALTAPECEPAAAGPCFGQALAAQRGQLASALSRLTALTRPDGAQVLVTGYWNVFLDGEVGRARGPAYVAASDALTRQENGQLAAAAVAASAGFVDLYVPFKGADGTRDDTALLAPDGDHPDAAGHELIARTLLAAVPGP